jgi:predicted metal-dependent peptidase
MSSTKREKISAKILEEEKVDPQLKKQALQTAIYEVCKENPFIGTIIQSLEISYSHMIPRLGIMFDSDAKKWKMLVNPHYFCVILSREARVAVLLHEISHVTHKHPIRIPFLKINPQRRMLMNIAMDMAINQYIKNLPYGCSSCPPDEEAYKGAKCENEKCPGKCIMVEDYYDMDSKTGQQTSWPKNKSFEFYYEKLIEKFQDAQNNDGQSENEGDGSGSPQEFDSHHWDSNAEESELLDSTEELIKRAIQKQGLSYSDLPQHIKELLADIDARRAELNYRALILSAIKRNASGFDRKHTWTRRSRRFGEKAPGTKNGELPHLHNYIDTSGSISVQEANDFLDIIDNFLKVGSRKCGLSLWHTNVYHTESYKLGRRLDTNVVESGGTDMEETLRHIKDKDPDLAIILTDGCYSDVNYESWLKPGQNFPQVLKRLGETIKIPDTDYYGRDKRLED